LDAKSSLSSSAILALSSGAAQRTPTSVTLAKPASVFDFEKAWSNIKDDTAAFWDYFLVRIRCSSSSSTSGSRKMCVCVCTGHFPTRPMSSSLHQQQLLEPKNYAAFFGNSMTPAIISSIIAALTQHGLDGYAQIFLASSLHAIQHKRGLVLTSIGDRERFAQSLEVLRHLPSIRRWRIILKKEDKSGDVPLLCARLHWSHS
jgi:hypothetical protein